MKRSLMMGRKGKYCCAMAAVKNKVMPEVAVTRTSGRVAAGGVSKEIEAGVFESSSALIQAINPFGRYQYAAIVGAGTFALWSFGSTVPLYSCNEQYNYTTADLHSEKYQCDILYRCTNRTVKHSVFRSITDNFLLICDRKTYGDLILSLVGVGRVLGSLLGGHIGDYWGRKKALYPSQYGLCIVSTLSTACTQWQSFAVCSFLIGFLYGMGEVSSFTLVSEMVDQRHRWIVIACSQWPIQYAIVAAIGYLTADWRLYLIIINVILAPLLVFFLIFAESPRFLLYHEYWDRAAKVLTDIASDRWNRTGREFREEELAEIPSTRGQDPRYPSPLYLFNSWPKARLTSVLMFAMLTRSLGSNIFIQSSATGPDNPFLSIALYGLSRLWVPIFIVLADRKIRRLGRRTIFQVSFSVIALLALVLEICRGAGVKDGVWSTVLGMGAAALSASAGWMSVAIIMLESYPTAIRGIAYGWIGMTDGIGALIASLGLRNKQWWIPTVFLILPAILTVVLGFFWVPETKFSHLQDGLHEIHKASAKKRAAKIACKQRRNGDAEREFR